MAHAVTQRFCVRRLQDRTLPVSLTHCHCPVREGIDKAGVPVVWQSRRSLNETMQLRLSRRGVSEVPKNGAVKLLLYIII